MNTSSLEGPAVKRSRLETDATCTSGVDPELNSVPSSLGPEETAHVDTTRAALPLQGAAADTCEESTGTNAA